MVTTRRTATAAEPAGPDSEDERSLGASSGDEAAAAAARRARVADDDDGPRAMGEEEESESDAEGSDGEEDEDDEDEEEVEWSEGSDDEPGAVFGLFNRSAAAGAHARQMAQFPLLRDWVPPRMQHELASELSMRTAALCPRGAPLLRQASGAGASTSGRGAAEGPATPAPQQARGLNPAHALLLREARQGSGGGRMLPEQCAHFAAFHRLPARASRQVDRMRSRGYIARFTDDGQTFIAAYQHERRIRMYDVAAGFRLAKDVHARGLQWTVTDTALSGDGRYLLYSSITPEVHLVTVAGCGGSAGVESVANVTDIHETLDFGGGRHGRLGIWSIQWSADSREIVAGTSDPGIRVYDMLASRCVAQAGGHGDDVNAVAYADPASATTIFSGSDDHFVKVWDRRTMGAEGGRRCRPVGVFVGHTEGVTHLDSKGDGRYVISNAKDQTIKLWDTRMMASAKEAAAQHREAPTFGGRWDYRWMEYPAQGRVVQHPHCCAVQTYRGHAVLSTLIRSYWSPAATTGQRYIYTGSYDGRVVIYDAITAQPVAKLGGYHRECVRDVSWHPTLPLLATVSFDGTAVLWEPEVPGEAEAAAEEAEAVAEGQQPGSGQRAARRAGAGHGLPEPSGDQLVW